MQFHVVEGCAGKEDAGVAWGLSLGELAREGEGGKEPEEGERNR